REMARAVPLGPLALVQQPVCRTAGGDNALKAGISRVAQAQDDDVGGERVGGGRDDQVEDLMQRALRDDRPLDFEKPRQKFAAIYVLGTHNPRPGPPYLAPRV